MKSKEDIYDEQIAPELLRLGKLCEQHGMSFIACVEYDPPNLGIGRTESMQPDRVGLLSCAQRLTHWAARANGNVDALIFALMKHARDHGHSSVCMNQLLEAFPSTAAKSDEAGDDRASPSSGDPSAHSAIRNPQSNDDR